MLILVMNLFLIWCRHQITNFIVFYLSYTYRWTCHKNVFFQCPYFLEAYTPNLFAWIDLIYWRYWNSRFHLIFIVLWNVTLGEGGKRDRIRAGVFKMVGVWMVELLESIFVLQIEDEWRISSSRGLGGGAAGQYCGKEYMYGKYGLCT